MRRSRRRHASIKSRGLRAIVEQLEQRKVLAGVMVDKTFDFDGLVIADTSVAHGSDNVLTAVDAVTGNKVWAAGKMVDQSGDAFGAVARFNADGSADVTFGAGGRLVSATFSQFTDVKGLADGGAVVTGWMNGPDGSADFGLLKLLADGSPDPKFGARGLARADFGGTQDQPESVAALSDGTFIVVGNSRQGVDDSGEGGSWDFAVAKFDAQGNLDASFSGDGKQTVDFAGSDDWARQVKIDGAGRIVIAGSTVVDDTRDFALARLTGAGVFDRSFGSNGKVTTDFSKALRDDEAVTLEIQAGNNIIVAGYTVSEFGDKDFAVARYSGINGGALGGFGVGGQKVLDLSRGARQTSNDEIGEIKIDARGNIVALGTSADSIVAQMAAVVLNGTTGALDTSFDPDTGGRLFYDFFARPANRGVALDIDPAGRWVSGSVAGNQFRSFAVTRMAGTSGVVDATFGNVGRVGCDFTDQTGANDDASDVAVLADGSAIIVGSTTTDRGPDENPSVGVVFKLTARGVLDDQFAANGRFLAEQFLTLDGVALLPDGGILAVGTIVAAGGLDEQPFDEVDIGVVKLLPTGALDPSFGSRGVVALDLGFDESAAGIVLQPDGKIVLAGTATVLPHADFTSDFVVARLDATGNVDPGFGVDGERKIDFFAANDEAHGVALDSQGRIVVVGAAKKVDADTDFAIARLGKDGGFDNTFNDSGIATIDFGSAGLDDIAYCVAIQAGDNVIAAGSHRVDSAELVGETDFAVVRLDSRGRPQTGFGQNGEVTRDFTSGPNKSSDEARAVKIDAWGRIVLAGSTWENSFPSRGDVAHIVLNGTTGADVKGFDVNTGGRLYSSFFTYGDNKVAAMVIDRFGGWLTVGSTHEGNVGVLRRNGVSGLPDAAYGNGGRAVLDGTELTGAVDVVRGLDVDPWGRSVFVSESKEGVSGSVMRLTRDGQPDKSFGVGGIVFVESGSFSDVVALPTGEVLATGATLKEFFVVKLKVDGSLDAAFGKGGIAMTEFGVDKPICRSLVVQKDGRIVVAGDVGGDLAVARFATDGNLDQSFSDDGMQTIDFFENDDSARCVKVDSKGRIVVVGQTQAFSDGDGTSFLPSDFAVARLTSAGGLDAGFGDKGKIVTDIGNASQTDSAKSVVVQADDSLVVGGDTWAPSDLPGTGASRSDWALVRYDSRGIPLAGFGEKGSGQLVVDLDASDSIVSSLDSLGDVELDSAGRVVAFGSLSTASSKRWAVAAFDGITGAIDTTFNQDSGGIYFLDLYGYSAPQDVRMTIDREGAAVLGGFTGGPQPGNIAAARLFLSNRAPSLNPAGKPVLPNVAEDTLNPAGTKVADIAAKWMSDANGDSLGIAIEGVTQASSGAWQFSLDGGKVWSALGAPSPATSRVLRGTDLVRFVPKTDFNGAAQFVFRAWDQTDGTAAGAVINTAGRIGGTKSLSSATLPAVLSVTPVNDAPVLVPGANPSLGTVLEDAVSPAPVSVNSFAAARMTDVDPGAARGVAIVGATQAGNGTWQFSTNGGSAWTALGTPSEAAARVLRITDAVRFVPKANFNGLAQLVFRAWDQTDLTAAGGLLNTAARIGGAGSVSAITLTANLTVSPVNDAPVVAAGVSLPLGSIAEDTSSPPGVAVNGIIGGPQITDVDAGAVRGIGIVGATQANNGTWQFSTNAGGSWVALGTPSESAARVLRATDLVRFVPNPNFNGSAQIVCRAWDQTDGTAPGGLLNTSGRLGGAGSLSVTAFTAVVTVTPVNDAPVLVAGGVVTYVRNMSPVVLAAGATVSDVDGDDFSGGLLTVSITRGGGTANRLWLGSNFTVDFSNRVFLGGTQTQVGTVESSGFGWSDLKVRFNSNATRAIVENLVRSVTYQNLGGVAAWRTIDLRIFDRNQVSSGVQSISVNVV